MMNPKLSQLFSFLEESPEDSFILYAIAKEYEKLGEQEQALEYYLKLVALDPNYIGTYYHLGKLFEEMQEHEKAIDIYIKGIDTAKKIKDLHALSELMGAKMNAEMEL